MCRRQHGLQLEPSAASERAQQHQRQLFDLARSKQRGLQQRMVADQEEVAGIGEGGRGLSQPSDTVLEQERMLLNQQGIV